MLWTRFEKMLFVSCLLEKVFRNHGLHCCQSHFLRLSILDALIVYPGQKGSEITVRSKNY